MNGVSPSSSAVRVTEPLVGVLIFVQSASGTLLRKLTPLSQPVLGEGEFAERATMPWLSFALGFSLGP